MKWIKRIVFGIIAIVAVLVVISFFLPSQAHVARSITIDAPPEQVYPYVSSLRRTSEWSPWVARDPGMVQTYSGPDEGVGQKVEWQSENPEVGTGSQTVTASEANRHVGLALDFGDMGTADAGFDLAPAGAGTQVTWTFDTELGMNPIKRYFGLMMDHFLGSDYEAGLSALKALVESNATDQE
jgi:uncharacterized protein YndB with AHSA1/START domain